jgi:hypothetical protein
MVVPDAIPVDLFSLVFLAKSLDKFVQAGVAEGFGFPVLSDLAGVCFYRIFVDQR